MTPSPERDPMNSGSKARPHGNGPIELDLPSNDANPGIVELGANERTTYPFRADPAPLTSTNTEPANGPLRVDASFLEAAARAFEHSCTLCGEPAPALLGSQHLCIACKAAVLALTSHGVL